MEDVSIIIPVYGVEKYIEQFMESLISQTKQNFIAIFVNDKTEDNSINIVKKYSDFFVDRMVILENNINVGLSESRNVGIEYVRHHMTKYITFLDPDDWIERDYLEELYETSEKYDLDLCIGGIVRCLDTSENIICTEMISFTNDVIEDFNTFDELAIINPCSYAKLFRFEPIKNIKFRNVKRSEDTCYLFECLKEYSNAKFTNKAKYYYRVRSDSLTGNISREKYESMHEEFSKIVGEFDDYKGKRIIDQFVTQIFIRSSVGGVCRISFLDMKKIMKIEKEEYRFLNNAIPMWRQNRYLRLFPIRMHTPKIWALKVCALLYKIHVFFIFIIIYYFYNQILGKDMRA